MNLILLADSDFISPTQVRLQDRRLAHIRNILKVQVGQTLTVGRINGLIGEGRVLTVDEGMVELDVKLDAAPPSSLPMTLIIALTRPLMFKRMLFSAAMLGVKKIIVLNFNRVEKSLWQSSVLTPEVIEEQFILGLEQAKDTRLPEIVFKRSFKTFVQDELSLCIQGQTAFLAHPGESITPLPSIEGPIALIIGPEGGIIDYEIDQLVACGCKPISFGPRILRTDAVLPFVAGKLVLKGL